MNVKRLKRVLLFCPLLLLLLHTTAWAQTNVSGTVLDDKGAAIQGASVLVKGTSVGVATDAAGKFSLNVPPNSSTLTVTYVGYIPQDVSIQGNTNITVTLLPEGVSNLNEVVVIGYGTAKKKDLTGAVATVNAKNFNKGTYASPDQLIQGKVAGVQITNNSGQPGGGTTVKIRGSSSVSGPGQPLYVVDGVALDGRSPRPGVGDLGLGGGNPSSNPLNFINPNDIASIDILKDASATAIYGSRAAYGVVLITTKRGQSGQTKIDFSASTGVSSIMRRIRVLNADEFRDALTYYDVPNAASNDKGGDVDALDAILQNGLIQNYNMGISGGNENAKYRLSAGYQNQEGIVRKSGFKKYSANFNTNLKFLPNKNAGIDINITPSQYQEDIPPITNDAGASGSLIGQALQWNPTLPLKIGDSLVNVGGNSILNPLGVSEAYNDRAKVTTILASLSPYYKITKDLEYRFLYSVNYGVGVRRTSVRQDINIQAYQNRGYAAIAQNELTTQQLTHTLNFNKDITNDFSISALAGFEYIKFGNRGSSMSGIGLQSAGGFGYYGLDYTDYIQFSDPENRTVSSFRDPFTALQSFFGRASLNFKDKYLVTGTFRRDGSTKFGKNNKYGNFPSFAAAWNVNREEFFKDVTFVTALKIRGGWGKTGNQEFPSGSAQSRYTFTSGNAFQLNNNPNPELKWQSDRQFNIGFDATLFRNRLSFTFDYFNKLTRDLLFPTVPIAPSAPGAAVTWKNIAGKIENKGVEVSMNASLIDEKDFSIDINANAAFIKNNVSDLAAPIQTGALNGQGLSGVTSQFIINGYPINAFFLKEYTGIDKATGLATYTSDEVIYYAGSPNPKAVVGFGTTIRYKKLSLTANFNSSLGTRLYNNTFNNVINVGDIKGGRNIAYDVYANPVKESIYNYVTASSRYLENGSFVKLTNATLSYNLGDIANVARSTNIFVTGQNLFVITKFQGFDPEVNVDKSVNGVPSNGIEYIPYPSARTITLGINFSL